MKQTVLTLVIIALGLAAWSQDLEAEKEAIQQVIDKAYVEGLHNAGDLTETEIGFHPGFNLLGVRNNMLTKYPIYSWLESSRARQEKGEQPAHETTAQYPMIDVTGHAAVAKVELYREGKKIFTDYLSLYKFEEGWRVVSKTYHRHK